MLTKGRLGNVQRKRMGPEVSSSCVKDGGWSAGAKVFSLESLGEACTGLPGSPSKTHPDLHVVVGVNEPGHVRWTLQDEHGVGIAGSAPQLHLHSHCPGPAGRQTPASARAGTRGWAGSDWDWPGRDKAWGGLAASALLPGGM